MTTWFKITRTQGRFNPDIWEVQVKKFTHTFIWIAASSRRPDAVEKRRIHAEWDSHFPTREEAERVLKLRAEDRLKKRYCGKGTG